MTVELSSGSSPPVTGSLENVSASGAFVRVDQRGPPRGPIVVILRHEGSGRTRSVRLAAYVVRETEGGVGIEWCRFAPRAVREIMLHGPERPGARKKALTARRPLQESDTVMPPRAQPPAPPSAIRTRTQ
jgi:hypothetical protein